MTMTTRILFVAVLVLGPVVCSVPSLSGQDESSASGSAFGGFMSEGEPANEETVAKLRKMLKELKYQEQVLSDTLGNQHPKLMNVVEQRKYWQGLLNQIVPKIADDQRRRMLLISDLAAKLKEDTAEFDPQDEDEEELQDLINDLALLVTKLQLKEKFRAEKSALIDQELAGQDRQKALEAYNQVILEAHNAQLQAMKGAIMKSEEELQDMQSKQLRLAHLEAILAANGGEGASAGAEQGAVNQAGHAWSFWTDKTRSTDFESRLTTIENELDEIKQLLQQLVQEKSDK